RRADELLEKMGLSKAGDDRIEGYSRGMLQRLGIAQALINNPDLIVLDEPVSGLDPLGRREVKQILIDLRDEGKTVFFSSHILADVEEMCDEVSIMNHGNLLIKGPMDEILMQTGLRMYAKGLSPEIIDKAGTIAQGIVKEGDRWGFDLPGKESREAMAAFIKQNGGDIDEVVSKRETLEESFLRRIGDDEARLKEAETA
ncbi:MAG: ABC transporter ATP-binding protein, partial [Planctomycetes bacterium]|nr:ABC transporter ATP-binding protein [Planctomycetota bacterium]